MGRAYDPRPDKLRRTGLVSQRTTYAGGVALYAAFVQAVINLPCGRGGGDYKSYIRRSLTRATGAICRPAPSIPITIHGDGRARTWTRGRTPNIAADRRPWSGPPLSKTLCVTLAEPAYFPASRKNFGGDPDTFGYYRGSMAGSNGLATAGRCWPENTPFNAQQRPRGHAPNEKKKLARPIDKVDILGYICIYTDTTRPRCCAAMIQRRVSQWLKYIK